MKTDAIDRLILSALQREGRLPLGHLSRRIGLAQDATRRRLQRLIDERVILGFEAVVDASRTQAGLVVFVHVHLDPVLPATVLRLKRAVRNDPAVIECHELAGGADFMLKTRVADLAAFRRLVAQLVEPLPGVKALHAYPVVEEHIGGPSDLKKTVAR